MLWFFNLLFFYFYFQRSPEAAENKREAKHQRGRNFGGRAEMMGGRGPSQKASKSTRKQKGRVQSSGKEIFRGVKVW
jgi:hypothetical protein